MPTEAYYKACDALINGNWGRIHRQTGQTEQRGSYFTYSNAPNCLCALGVLAHTMRTDTAPITLDRGYSLVHDLSVGMGISMSILRAAEILYENWYMSVTERYVPHLRSAGWSHKQVGEWLLKVGKAIEVRNAKVALRRAGIKELVTDQPNTFMPYSACITQ